MKNYKIINSALSLRDDGAYVSVEHPEYLQWLSEGNEPEPADPIPPPPILPISPRQIRQALTSAGLRAAVEAAVATGDQDLKDWYEFSTAFERVNPQVVAMATTLGVSEQSLDKLWLLGASL